MRLPPSNGRSIELLGNVVAMLTVTVAAWFGLTGLKVQFESDGKPVQV